MNADNTIVKQWQEQKALERFQMIAPLLEPGLDIAKKATLRRKIAEEHDVSLRSVYRYEKAYREGQFSGLKPRTRVKHRSQRLPENFDHLLEQAIQLRREVPELNIPGSVSPVSGVMETAVPDERKP